LADGYEIIVVDDGSSDGTSETARRYPVTLIRHEVNKGKGEALKTGIQAAHGEKVIWIDADGTYPVEYIPRIAGDLDTYDVVVCSRRTGRENIPLFNRTGNFAFRTMIKYIYGFKPFDPCSGLYGIRKSHLSRMALFSNGFAIEPEISIKVSRMKLKMQDIPIEYGARVGTTKLNSFRAGWDDLVTILRLLFWRPRR
jgi:glycosyltransferase involved in cell wall biosynthesis